MAIGVGLLLFVGVLLDRFEVQCSLQGYVFGSPLHLFRFAMRDRLGPRLELCLWVVFYVPWRPGEVKWLGG